MLTPSRIKASALSVVLACLPDGGRPRRCSRAPGAGLYQEWQGAYVHDNIAASVAAIKKLGAEQTTSPWTSRTTRRSFTDQNLKRYKALVFDNTNNEIFDNEEQKAAFQRYIRAGGGFVGIHSATGSMRIGPGSGQ